MLPKLLADSVSPMSVEFQLGLISFLGLVILVLNVWDRLKPKDKNPPDHEIYATKTELADTEDRLMKNLDAATVERNHKFDGLSSQVSALQTSMQNGFQEIFFKLGVAEGQAKSPAARARRPKP